jgi:hypothetical protein
VVERKRPESDTPHDLLNLKPQAIRNIEKFRGGALIASRHLQIEVEARAFDAVRNAVLSTRWSLMNGDHARGNLLSAPMIFC